MSYKNSTAIVIGSNGGIGNSVYEQLKNSGQYDQVLGFNRYPSFLLKSNIIFFFPFFEIQSILILPKTGNKNCEHFLCAWSPLVKFFFPLITNILLTLIGKFFLNEKGINVPLFFSYDLNLIFFM